MKQTTNILIFKLLLLLVAMELFSAPLHLSQNDALEVKTVSDRPVTISFNFEVSDIKLIVTSEDMASLEILRKGFVLIPKRSKYFATIVVIARDGSTYSISMSSGGRKTMLRIEDPLQNYKDSGKLFEFESGRMDTDARNIIKTLLLDKKLSGFVKAEAYQLLKTKQYSIARTIRYSGSKYIVDQWSIINTSKRTLYFEEEDFYTEGVLAVALEKNRLLKGEKIFLITILNKSSVYKKEKGD